MNKQNPFRITRLSVLEKNRKKRCSDISYFIILKEIDLMLKIVKNILYKSRPFPHLISDANKAILTNYGKINNNYICIWSSNKMVGMFGRI